MSLPRHIQRPRRPLAVAFYGLSLTLVRADAGYFTYLILNFIRTVLGAGFMIDYNLRRKGKRFLATSPTRVLARKTII